MSGITDELHKGNDFLKKVIAVIEENLGDEHFGVPDLAGRLSMSRSNLLRKVKQLTGLSVIVFIRKVRLYHGREILKDDELTAAEVAFSVGFNSPSYFTKCFKEEFGYTPGDRQHSPVPESIKVQKEVSSDARSARNWLVPLTFVLVSIIGVFLYLKYFNEPAMELPLEKTIAVLPFKNDSNDSSNVYLINGMMQTILNNLQQIDELKVTSRTTVEKYRNANKSVPEIAEELQVNYFVEGSGQKVGDQILLSIQLIDGRNDKHIWSKQYSESVKDIFKLQAEVAKNIASEIQVIISPEVQQNIEKIPTDNPVAYDYYLKGLDFSSMETNEGLLSAIVNFKSAIKEDPQFANAYAYLAICYYYLDIFQANKKYGNEINTYADQASLYDPDLAESQIAKALFYLHDGQYELAVEFLEKVLTYYPNSAWVHNLLSDIYTSYLPNTTKYLEHAIQGIHSTAGSQDSVTASFTYLHLSNALAQTGFLREADQYVQRSLAYKPDNLYSQYLHVYIRLAENFNLPRAKNELIEILDKDPTRIDVIQEIGKLCYTLEQYEESWSYYEQFVRVKKQLDLDIFPAEDIKIAYVLSKIGQTELADEFYQIYRNYSATDSSIYQNLNFAAYYATQGETDLAMNHLKLFSQEDDILYWVVLMLDKDPIIRLLSNHPEYRSTLKQINERFWEGHRKKRELLVNEGLLE